MEVTFTFNSQFCGNTTKTVDLQSNLSHKDIISMFPSVLGIEYDDNCSYEADNKTQNCIDTLSVFSQSDSDKQNKIRRKVMKNITKGIK